MKVNVGHIFVQNNDNERPITTDRVLLSRPQPEAVRIISYVTHMFKKVKP